MATAQDVAQWMLEEITQRKELFQIDAVAEIERRFGKEFLYVNDSGGTSIDRKVLRLFRSLTEQNVVWSRSERYWRLRGSDDDPGRQQYW